MQMLDILVTDIAALQKKKRGQIQQKSKKGIGFRQDRHILGIYIHWDLDSNYLGITWKMGNCTFAIVLGVITLFL